GAWGHAMRHANLMPFRFLMNATRHAARPAPGGPHPRVLILTPLKDAADSLAGYRTLLTALTYPHALVSVGLLESDSGDQTFALARRLATALRAAGFRRVELWQRH